MGKKRHLYIEALRVMACLAVLFNHSPRSSYFLFAQREPGSLLYFFDLTMSIGCKFAVPVFFAISGALLLDREISLRKLWTRRIPKAAATLIVFSVISSLIGVMAGERVPDVKAFIFRLYESDHNYAYWYLYAYIAFLIGAPMLSAMLRSLSDREILYMIGAALVFRCVLPAFEQLRWEGAHRLNAELNLAWLTADIVLYPSMGYFLHHRMDTRACRRALPLLWAAALAGLAVSLALTWQEYQRLWITHIETYHKWFSGVLAMAIFATARVLYEGVPLDSRLAGWTTRLGGVTLGVYLLHVPVMNHTRLFQELVWIPMDALHLPQLVCGMIYIALLFAACGAATAVIKRIPGLGRLLS